MNKWTKTTAALLALGIASSSVPYQAYAGGGQATQAQQTTAQAETQATKELAQQNMMSVSWLSLIHI